MTTDQQCLTLYRIIQDAFNTQSQLTGVVNNIIGLFFHDLMVHFSGIIIHQHAIEEYQDSLAFPYINKAYANEPFKVPKLTSLHKPYSTLIHHLYNTSVLPIAIGEAIPIGYKASPTMIRLLTCVGHRPTQVQAQLADHSQQIAYLLHVIASICQQFGFSNAQVIQDNWSRYARLHTTDIQKTIKCKILFLGTRCILHNRKLAINYLSQGKKVVGFTHGEMSNTVLDEPVFGYADLSYCTTLVDYGKKREYGQYNQPLVVPKTVLSRSSGSILRIHSQKPINAKIKKNLKTLYVPTLFSGNKLYGPFRGFEDAVYMAWQTELIQQLQAHFKDVTLKTHPKGEKKLIHTCTTISKRLEDCIQDYDLIVLDYYSTAATLSIATNKPIIYFDLGCRHFNPSFKQQLEERCYYCKINLEEEHSTQVSSHLDHCFTQPVELVNRMTSDYCLADKPARHLSYRQITRTLFN